MKEKQEIRPGMAQSLIGDGHNVEFNIKHRFARKEEKGEYDRKVEQLEKGAEIRAHEAEIRQTDEEARKTEEAAKSGSWWGTMKNVAYYATYPVSAPMSYLVSGSGKEAIAEAVNNTNATAGGELSDDDGDGVDTIEDQERKVRDLAKRQQEILDNLNALEKRTDELDKSIFSKVKEAAELTGCSEDDSDSNEWADDTDLVGDTVPAEESVD